MRVVVFLLALGACAGQLKADPLDGPDDDTPSGSGGARDTAPRDTAPRDTAPDHDPSCTPGSAATCPATSCADLHARGSRSSGLAWIRPASTTYQVLCEQALDGGGWTLVAAVTQDYVPHWSWDAREAYTDQSNATFGAPDRLDADHRSLALVEAPMRSVLFRHVSGGVPQPRFARYDLDAVQPSFGAWVRTGSEPDLESVCYAARPGLPMAAGNVTLGGGLCSTHLFLSPQDQDGGADCACPTCTADAFGPAWSFAQDGGCPLDDVGARGGLGAQRDNPHVETGNVGFVVATGDLVADVVDGMLIYVR